ncbi:Na(+)/H(+) antiporter subunit F, partial [Butyricicoccus sp. 1XD8-22]
MKEMILMLALALFMVAIFLNLYRVIVGPSMPDRAIALDTIGVNLISAIAIV